MKYPILILLLISVQPGGSQSRSNQASDFYQQALSHYRKQELGSAMDLINSSIELNPTANGYYLRGLIHEAQGREIRAIADYEATIQVEEDFREAIFQKAILYLRNGDPEQAIRDFDLLISKNSPAVTHGIYFEVDPADGKALDVLTMENSVARIYYYRGAAYQKLGERANALIDYDRAIELEKRSEYFNARALLLEIIGERDNAIASLKEAIVCDSLNQIAWYNLLRLSPETQFPDELAQNEAGPTTSLLATRAHEEGNYEQALKFYDLFLSGDKQDPLILINRGRVLLKLNKFEEARTDFMKARNADPTRFETLYLTGNSYFYQRDYSHALAFYNEYITVNPGDASVWYNGAISHMNMDQQAEACHYLSRAAKLGMAEADSLFKSRCQE